MAILKIGEGVFEHVHKLPVETAKLDKVNHLVTLQQDNYSESIRVAGLVTVCLVLLKGDALPGPKCEIKLGHTVPFGDIC